MTLSGNSCQGYNGIRKIFNSLFIWNKYSLEKEIRDNLRKIGNLDINDSYFEAHKRTMKDITSEVVVSPVFNSHALDTTSNFPY